MKDLKFLHAAHSAPVDAVEVLGYRSAAKEFRPEVFAGATALEIAADTVSSLYDVVMGGQQLRQYQGEGTIPDNSFRVVKGDVDVVELYKPLDDVVVVTYSTTAMAEAAVLSVKGRGFTYAGQVKVLGKVYAEVEVVNDSELRVALPTTVASQATPANVSVLVFVANIPGVSDVVADISVRNRTVAGVELLRQRFLTLLLDPAAGNLYGILPKTAPGLSQGLQTVILNRVNIAVSATKKLMLRQPQASSNRDEILADAKVVGIRTEDNGLSISIRLRTAAGTEVVTPVPSGG